MDMQGKNYFSLNRNLTLERVNLITSLEGEKRLDLESLQGRRKLVF